MDLNWANEVENAHELEIALELPIPETESSNDNSGTEFSLDSVPIANEHTSFDSDQHSIDRIAQEHIRNENTSFSNADEETVAGIVHNLNPDENVSCTNPDEAITTEIVQGLITDDNTLLAITNNETTADIAQDLILDENISFSNPDETATTGIVQDLIPIENTSFSNSDEATTAGVAQDHICDEIMSFPFSVEATTTGIVQVLIPVGNGSFSSEEASTVGIVQDLILDENVSFPNPDEEDTARSIQHLIPGSVSNRDEAIVTGIAHNLIPFENAPFSNPDEATTTPIAQDLITNENVLFSNPIGSTLTGIVHNIIPDTTSWNPEDLTPVANVPFSYFDEATTTGNVQDLIPDENVSFRNLNEPTITTEIAQDIIPDENISFLNPDEVATTEIAQDLILDENVSLPISDKRTITEITQDVNPALQMTISDDVNSDPHTNERYLSPKQSSQTLTYSENVNQPNEVQAKKDEPESTPSTSTGHPTLRYEAAPYYPFNPNAPVFYPRKPVADNPITPGNVLDEIVNVLPDIPFQLLDAILEDEQKKCAEYRQAQENGDAQQFILPSPTSESPSQSPRNTVDMVTTDMIGRPRFQPIVPYIWPQDQSYNEMPVDDNIVYETYEDYQQYEDPNNIQYMENNYIQYPPTYHDDDDINATFYELPCDLTQPLDQNTVYQYEYIPDGHDPYYPCVENVEAVYIRQPEYTAPQIVSPQRYAEPFHASYEYNPGMLPVYTTMLNGQMKIYSPRRNQRMASNRDDFRRSTALGGNLGPARSSPRRRRRNPRSRMERFMNGTIGQNLRYRHLLDEEEIYLLENMDLGETPRRVRSSRRSELKTETGSQALDWEDYLLIANISIMKHYKYKSCTDISTSESPNKHDTRLLSRAEQLKTYDLQNLSKEKNKPKHSKVNTKSVGMITESLITKTTKTQTDILDIKVPFKTIIPSKYKIQKVPSKSSIKSSDSTKSSKKSVVFAIDVKKSPPATPKLIRQFEAPKPQRIRKSAESTQKSLPFNKPNDTTTGPSLSLKRSAEAVPFNPPQTIMEPSTSQIVSKPKPSETVIIHKPPQIDLESKFPQKVIESKPSQTVVKPKISQTTIKSKIPQAVTVLKRPQTVEIEPIDQHAATEPSAPPTDTESKSPQKIITPMDKDDGVPIVPKRKNKKAGEPVYLTYAEVVGSAQQTDESQSIQLKRTESLKRMVEVRNIEVDIRPSSNRPPSTYADAVAKKVVRKQTVTRRSTSRQSRPILPKRPGATSSNNPVILELTLTQRLLPYSLKDNFQTFMDRGMHFKSVGRQIILLFFRNERDANEVLNTPCCLGSIVPISQASERSQEVASRYQNTVGRRNNTPARYFHSGYQT